MALQLFGALVSGACLSNMSMGIWGNNPTIQAEVKLGLSKSLTKLCECIWKMYLDMKKGLEKDKRGDKPNGEPNSHKVYNFLRWSTEANCTLGIT